MDDKLNPKFEAFSNGIESIIELYKNKSFDHSETLEVSLQETKNLKEKQSFILGINGKWGAGKTTFLNYFSKKIQASGKIGSRDCLIIKYNAWSQDYIDEPLISLIVQIYDQLIILENVDHEKQNNNIKTSSQNFSKKSNPLLKLVANITRSMKVKFTAGSEAVLHKLEIEFDGNKMIKDNSNASNLENTSYGFENFFQLHNATNEFKSALADINSKNSVTLIIIDELDRCIPLFAVKLLERLKHFFDVYNVVIILAYDKKNLLHSIQKVYGKIDANHYLSRFFNLEFNLPKLPENFQFAEFEDLDNEEITMVNSLFDYYNTSVRERKKIIHHIQTLRACIKGFFRNSIIMLLFLKIDQSEKFVSIANLDYGFSSHEKKVSTIFNAFQTALDIDKDDFDKNGYNYNGMNGIFYYSLVHIFFLFLMRDNIEQKIHEIFLPGTIHDDLPDILLNYLDNFMMQKHNFPNEFSGNYLKEVLSVIEHLMII